MFGNIFVIMTLSIIRFMIVTTQVLVAHIVRVQLQKVKIHAQVVGLVLRKRNVVSISKFVLTLQRDYTGVGGRL
ncbi:hypothetical protein D3C85_1699360 [compost metagenome]